MRASVHYHLCDACGFCFAPEIMRCPIEQFAARIYNEDYCRVDPEYLGTRPRTNAQRLASVFGKHALDIRHLDYGGGKGELSAVLFAAGWDSQSYDPFVDGALPAGFGKFNLVTSFEELEHAPDVAALVATLGSRLADRAVVVFTTALSDGWIARDQRLSRWYASPRNGHISLFSHKSPALLGAKAGFKLRGRSPESHMLWRDVPPRAADTLGLESKA